MIPGLPLELHYHKFFLVMIIITAFAVPKERYARYFWVSLVWGYFGSFLFALIFGEGLHLFEWRYLTEVKFWGANHWLCFAWALALMVYLRFLPTRKVWYALPVYILAFSFASAALDSNFEKLGLLHPIHWNPFYRFLVAIPWFYGAAKHQWWLEKADIKENAEEAR